MILMTAGTLQLYGLAVQQEAAFGIKDGGAHPERLLESVDQTACDADLSDKGMQARGLYRP